MPRKIGVVSVGRSDYGLYRPLLREIERSADFRLLLVAAGGHLSARFGNTLAEIIADGITPAAHVSCTPAEDGPADIAGAMGVAMQGFARAYDEFKPDILVVLGDRYETHAAAAAAVPFRIPVAHIAGGAITRGAMDDAFRHSISKLSHLHFPETDEQKQRLLRLGEESWRICVSGSLSIDNVLAIKPWSLVEMNRRLGTDFVAPPLLVTYHPETLAFESTPEYLTALLAALSDESTPVLFTYPGPDTAAHIVIDHIEAFCRSNKGRAYAIAHLGTEAYFSAIANAAAMVGNSSSGVIEAASFRLPVVNIGSRQEGRMAPANVIHSGHSADEIRRAIQLARSPGFRRGLEKLVNPYGDGNAASRIAAVLRGVQIDSRLLIKGEF